MVITNSMSGTILKNVDQDYLKAIKVPVPNENIVIEFNNSISIIEKIIYEKCKQNQELIKIRDFLLPLFMNGQVKINQ